MASFLVLFLRFLAHVRLLRVGMCRLRKIFQRKTKVDCILAFFKKRLLEQNVL